MDSQKESAELYPYYQLAWLEAVGASVVHQEHGGGSIVEVKLRNDYLPLISLKFADKKIMCNPDSFFKSNIVMFSDMQQSAYFLKLWYEQKRYINQKKLEAAANVAREKNTNSSGIVPFSNTSGEGVANDYDYADEIDRMHSEIAQGQEDWARSKSDGWFYDDND